MAVVEQKTEKSVENTSIDYAELAASKSFGYHLAKRFLDVVLSILALVVLSPVFLISALFIKLEDGGPVFFVQERTGLNGRVFRMIKFRTMCVGAAAMHQQLLKYNEVDGPVFKIRNDPRITRVGHFLRRTSIDELPQLINILRNEMSIVGPRPLATYEMVHCTPYQNQRHLIKPGLTCYWQCGGRNDVSFDHWIEMDLQYIKDASLWTDFKIICKTVLFVLRGVGAY